MFTTPANQHSKRGGSFVIQNVLRVVALIVAVILLMYFLKTSSLASSYENFYWKSTSSPGIGESGAGDKSLSASWTNGVPLPGTSGGNPNAKYLAAGRILDPELFRNGPLGISWLPSPGESPFLKDIRNPCFSREADAAEASGRSESKTYCLPYFYITGSFHSGANDVAAALEKHPNVVTDASSNSQFWAESDKTMSGFLDGFKRATETVLQSSHSSSHVIMERSLSTFPFYWAANIKAHRAFARTMSSCYGECVKASEEQKPEQKPGQEPVKSEETALNKTYHRNLTVCMEDVCYPRSRDADIKACGSAGVDALEEAHTPMLVHATYWDRPPYMILIVRDPIARLYGAFMGYHHYTSKYGKTPEGFATYVDEQMAGLESCAAKNGGSIRECLLRFETFGVQEEAVFFHADQFMRGTYSTFLEMWQKFIAPKYWLVLRSEDVVEDPLGTMRRITEFLKIRPLPADGGSNGKGERKDEEEGKGGSGGKSGGSEASKSAADNGKSETESGRILRSLGRKGAKESEDLPPLEAAVVKEMLDALGVKKFLKEEEDLPPLLPATVRKLREFYAPFNQRLAELTGDSRFEYDSADAYSVSSGDPKADAGDDGKIKKEESEKGEKKDGEAEDKGEDKKKEKEGQAKNGGIPKERNEVKGSKGGGDIKKEEEEEKEEEEKKEEEKKEKEGVRDEDEAQKKTEEGDKSGEEEEGEKKKVKKEEEEDKVEEKDVKVASVKKDGGDVVVDGKLKAMKKTEQKKKTRKERGENQTAAEKDTDEKEKGTEEEEKDAEEKEKEAEEEVTDDKKA